MTPTRFLPKLQPPPPLDAVAVATPSFGEGEVSTTSAGIHAVWPRLLIPCVRRGLVRLDVRIGVDGDGAFVPLGAKLSSSTGASLDGSAAREAQAEVDGRIRGECLAAASEIVALHPAGSVAALRALQPRLDDETLSVALGRVSERLDLDPRLRDVARARDALRPEGAPTLRETVEDLVRDMRHGGPTPA